MSFTGFRYHPRTEAGLRALFREGGEPAIRNLKSTIQGVQGSWNPDSDDSVYLVELDGFFLSFTAASEDPSILILAGVEARRRQ